MFREDDDDHDVLQKKWFRLKTGYLLEEGSSCSSLFSVLLAEWLDGYSSQDLKEDNNSNTMPVVILFSSPTSSSLFIIHEGKGVIINLLCQTEVSVRPCSQFVGGRASPSP